VLKGKGRDLGCALAWEHWLAPFRTLKWSVHSRSSWEPRKDRLERRRSVFPRVPRPRGPSVRGSRTRPLAVLVTTPSAARPTAGGGPGRTGRLP